MLIPGIAVATGRLFVTDDSDTRKALDLVAADPGRQFTLALLGFIAMLTIVPAFLAAARLARRRRPLLTMIALGVNLIAYLSAMGVPLWTACTSRASRLPVEQRDGAAALIDAMWSEGLTGISTMIMVIGQLLGAILMGLALRGSIPTVGWVAMILSQPITSWPSRCPSPVRPRGPGLGTDGVGLRLLRGDRAAYPGRRVGSATTKLIKKDPLVASARQLLSELPHPVQFPRRRSQVRPQAVPRR